MWIASLKSEPPRQQARPKEVCLFKFQPGSFISGQGLTVKFVDLILLKNDREQPRAQEGHEHAQESQAAVFRPTHPALDLVDVAARLVFMVKRVEAAAKQAQQQPLPEAVLLPAKPGVQHLHLMAFPEKKVQAESNDAQQDSPPYVETTRRLRQRLIA